MTQDEIIRMAREAGVFTGDPFGVTITPELERFAALVSAHEREKRTKELMQLFLDPENQPTQFGTATLEHREAEILAEREACAKVADNEIMNTNMLTSYPPKSSAAWNIAAAIRARGEK